jgi:hypothetical protein
MPRCQKNPRPENPPTRNPGLESPHEPRPHQNQLAVRPQGRPTQVRLKTELFYAVKDLVRQIFQIRQILCPPAGSLVLPQTSEADHGNQYVLHPDHFPLGVAGREFDAGNRSEELNPYRRNHADDVIRSEKKFGAQGSGGEPKLAKCLIDACGILRVDADPHIQIVGGPDVTVNVYRVTANEQISTRFELSDFKNSLKSSGSDGIAIRNPSKPFERAQAPFDRPRQPIFQRVVRVRQAGDGEMSAVQRELVVNAWGHRIHRLPVYRPAGR